MIPSTERILFELNFRACSLILGLSLLTWLQMQGEQAIEMHAGRRVINASRQNYRSRSCNVRGFEFLPSRLEHSQATLSDLVRCQTVLSGFEGACI